MYQDLSFMNVPLPEDVLKLKIMVIMLEPRK